MFEKEAEEQAKQYMNKHTEKYNCENTKLETDNYNTGREYGFEDGYIAGAWPRENRIADLEKENRTLKSLLFCTKRSCNNCGKVTCENFQRQRIDCCGLWVSYKDYITELENK